MKELYIDFAELKAAFPIEDSFERLGLNMKQNGPAFRGPCPTCQSGGDRALIVTPAKHSFYCFGARIGGDVIALVAHIHDCDMKTAAAFLAGKGSGDKPDNKKSNASTVPQERNKEAARSLQPLSYLEPKHHLVQKAGLDEKTCAYLGAGYAPKGIMRGRMAIPIHDKIGNLVAYCGRALKGEHPKLIFPKDFKPEGYFFSALQIPVDEIALVRDPLDALIANQNGVENVVSVLTETINAAQLRLLAELMDDNDCQAIELY